MCGAVRGDGGEEAVFECHFATGVGFFCSLLEKVLCVVVADARREFLAKWRLLVRRKLSAVCTASSRNFYRLKSEIQPKQGCRCEDELMALYRFIMRADVQYRIQYASAVA